MDLALYSRVLWRFRVLVVLGLLLGTFLAINSYYKIGLDGGKPTLTHRKAEVYQTRATVFLASNQPVQQFTDPGRYIGLAPFYAQFANSDPVKEAVAKGRGCRGLEGSYDAVPAADRTYGTASGLPMVIVFGTGPSPALAERAAVCGTDAFLAYIRDEQVESRIPKGQRVQMTVINEPDANEAVLVLPRKKTLPIVVFMAVMFATIGLAFVLENARPGIRVLPSEDADDRTVKDVRRSA
jgi:hypothetical protein